MEPYEIKVQKIINTDQFRPAALYFLEYGHYCVAPKGTSAYFEYWDEETNRCLHGYTSPEGNHITGYFYFYLNYCQINQLINGKNVKSFPRYYDYDKVFFDTIEQCEIRGKHLAVLKARRKGYSYKIAAMLCRNYFFIEDSSSYAYASENEFLTKDGILTKAWNYMDFIDENTAWYKKRQKIDTKMHKRASFVVDREGVKIELGYKSEVIGVTLKNDVQKVRGKKAKLIIFEEAGKFPNLKEAWQIAKPSVQQGDEVFGLMIAFGTGGTADADFEGLRDLFYEPDSFNCLQIVNKWDDNATKPAGFFVPTYYNLSDKFMDKDGNSLIKDAIRYELSIREAIIKSASDKTVIDRHIAEYCVDKDTWVSYDGGIDRIKNIPNNFCTGENDLYKLITEDGTELIITKNHPIYTGKEYVELKDLKVGDTIKHLSTTFNKEYIKIKIDSDFDFLKYDLTIDEKWAEFLGFFMGDGFFYGKNGSLGIVFDLKDRNSAERMYNFLSDKFGYTQFNIKDTYIEIRIVNKNLIKLVKSLDLIEKSSSTNNWHWKRKVHVPDYIIKSPKSVVSAFLRGYFDSDGHIIKAGYSIGSFSKYRKMCLDIQLLLRGFNINAKLVSKIEKNGLGRSYNSNKVSIRACDIEKFKKEIRFVSNRKNEILDNYIFKSNTFKDYSFSKIKSIDFEKRDLTYNLETKNHYYSAQGIWVHNCFNPQEATLDISTNIFPKADLLAHLAYIRNNKKIQDFKQTGDLITDDTGKIVWKQELPRDLVAYKIDKGKNVTGQIVIWEHPVDNPPYGMYIGGIDSYDFDQSNVGSLGSIFIYKRFQGFDGTYDIIVAEYTGRPKTAEMFYEKVRKLLIYYNAKALYENQNPGLLNYFRQNHCDFLLADQPDIISKIVGSTTVQRTKGLHMTKEIKAFGEGLIKDWSIKERGDGRLNLHTILSEPLLEELIYYNDKGNFDRVMSFMQVMFYKEELHNVIIKERKEENKENSFFKNFNFNNYDNINYNLI